MKRIPMGICIALLATFVWQTADARAHTFEPRSPKIDHAYATNIVDAVDTFGLRTGMTLAEASRAAAAWGMDLSLPDETVMHGGFIDGPSPDLFKLIATPNDKFRGFNSMGSTGERTATVRVFPRDPSKNIRDPDNLIVYWITSTTEPPVDYGSSAQPPKIDRKPSGAVMKRGGAGPNAGPTPGTIDDIQRDAFFAQARQRFGDIQDFETDGANQNPSHCSNAVGIPSLAPARGISYRAGKPDPLGTDDNPVVKAWRPCGDVISLGAGTLPDGRVRSTRVDRFDTELGEAAYQSFRQFIGYHY